MTDVPGINPNMPQARYATVPGSLEMPTTMQADADGIFIGELSDDQLSIEEIVAEQRACHELFLEVAAKLEQRQYQLHALWMSRMRDHFAAPQGFGPLPGVGKFIEVIEQ